MSIRFSKVTLVGAMALMLAGFSATAQAFSGPLSLTGVERQVQIKGQVVCTGCRLKEVRKDAKYRDRAHLYELLLNGQQPVVVELQAVSNSVWLNNIIEPYLWVRGAEAQLQKLNARGTVAKEVEIAGVVTSSNVLNVTGVAVQYDVESNKVAQQ